MNILKLVQSAAKTPASSAEEKMTKNASRALLIVKSVASMFGFVVIAIRGGIAWIFVQIVRQIILKTARNDLESMMLTSGGSLCLKLGS